MRSVSDKSKCGGRPDLAASGRVVMGDRPVSSVMQPVGRMHRRACMCSRPDGAQMRFDAAADGVAKCFAYICMLLGNDPRITFIALHDDAQVSSRASVPLEKMRCVILYARPVTLPVSTA